MLGAPKKGKRFGGSAAHQKAMMGNLVASLIAAEGIVTTEAKAKALRPDVPIIMITAYGDTDTKRRALERGAAALFTKPIDFATLRSEIDTRVGSAA